MEEDMIAVTIQADSPHREGNMVNAIFKNH